MTDHTERLRKRLEPYGEIADSAENFVLGVMSKDLRALLAERDRLAALVAEAESVCVAVEETIYDAIEFVDDEKEKRLACEDDEENPKTPYVLAAIATSDDLDATRTAVRHFRSKLKAEGKAPALRDSARKPQGSEGGE